LLKRVFYEGRCLLGDGIAVVEGDAAVGAVVDATSAAAEAVVESAALHGADIAAAGPVAGPIAGPLRGTFTARSSDDDSARFAGPGSIPSTPSDISLGTITGDGTTDFDSNSGTILEHVLSLVLAVILSLVSFLELFAVHSQLEATTKILRDSLHRVIQVWTFDMVGDFTGDRTMEVDSSSGCSGVEWVIPGVRLQLWIRILCPEVILRVKMVMRLIWQAHRPARKSRASTVGRTLMVKARYSQAILKAFS
jgi:hypothetical protein